MPKDCSNAINDQNKKAAKARDTPEYRTTSVTITPTDGEVITFLADGSPLKHTARWKGDADTWPACPSTLPSSATADDVGPPPSSGDGTLLLSLAYLDAEKAAKRSIVVGDDPKWPRGLAAEQTAYAPMPFRPTSIVVTGVELVSGLALPATFELLDPSLAAPDQSLSYSNESKRFSLKLSRTAFESVGLSFAPFEDLSRAAEIIDQPHRDPARLAWAWLTVQSCVNRLADERDAGRSTGEQEALLQRLLGDGEKPA
jgi:hypothetical protein